MAAVRVRTESGFSGIVDAHPGEHCSEQKHDPNAVRDQNPTDAPRAD